MLIARRIPVSCLHKSWDNRPQANNPRFIESSDPFTPKSSSGWSRNLSCCVPLSSDLIFFQMHLLPSAKARTWHNLPAGPLSRRAILLLPPLPLHLTTRTDPIPESHSALLLLATRLLLAYFLKMSMGFGDLLWWCCWVILSPGSPKLRRACHWSRTVFALFATLSSTLRSFRTSSSTTKLFVAS